MTDRVTVNVTDNPCWADSSPLLILAVCLVIAAVALLYGLRRMRERRHAHRDEHIVVDMAEPESLRDLPPEERP
ncbi:MAG TPA: hypothetical protein VEW25_10870 [Allosphingosinicella sp.]|nr:hypothetical protein [Allosphingosinicella sp.]